MGLELFSKGSIVGSETAQHTEKKTEVEIVTPKVEDKKKPQFEILSPKIEEKKKPQFEILSPKPKGAGVKTAINIPIPSSVVIDKSKNGKTRVLFAGTYAKLYSGYSNVVWNLLRRLGKKTDLEITHFAFQNVKQNSVPREDLPASINVFDCFAAEGGKKAGFGEELIGDYLKSHPQDVVIIYNDASVIGMLVKNIMEKLTQEEKKRTTFICYWDQVYQYQKERYVQMFSAFFDHIIAFTDYWKQFIKTQLPKPIPIDILPHGFDTDTYYPIKKEIARIYFSVPENAFVILNLNRCQPRKRLDHLCIVFAEVVKKHQTLLKQHPDRTYRPIKLLLGTALQGCWDLPEILCWEFKKRGLNPELINSYIIAISRPQQLTDREVNIIYNCADCGIHCVDGEGIGLTALEHMGVGVPQVANYVGGFKEFMNNHNSIICEPSGGYYIDSARDSIGGYAETCDIEKMVDGVWKLYQNPALVRKLGKQARADIVSHYKWDVLAEHLYKIIH